MPRICIGDGYEFKAATEPTARTPAIQYAYRPPLASEELAHLDAHVGIGQKSPAERAEELCQFIARHLVSWNATDDKDQPIPITAANLARVRDLHFLWQIEGELLKSKAEVAAEVDPDPAGTAPVPTVKSTCTTTANAAPGT